MLIVDYLLVFQIGFFGAPEYVISCSFSIEFIKYSAKERKRLGLFEGLNTCPSINQGVIRMSRHITENWVDLVTLPCKGTTPGVAGRAAAEEVVPPPHHPPLHLLLIWFSGHETTMRFFTVLDRF